MEVIGIIYKTTNQLNQKSYIGQTRRLKDKNYLGSGKLIKQALVKYGKENFTREILYECFTQKELDEKEVASIIYYETFSPIGYNLSEGGQFGMGFSKFKYLSEEEKEDFRNKIRDYQNLPEIKEKNKERALARLKEDNGFGNPWKNPDIDKEKMKQKISNTLKGRKPSEESLNKRSKSMVGKNKRKHTEEQNEKQRQKMKGKVLTEEHKNKIGEKSKGRPGNKKYFLFKCIETNKMYNNVTEAINDIGIGTLKIKAVCDGERPHTKNLHFAYCDEFGAILQISLE
jgi:group I intron endonuclease